MKRLTLIIIGVLLCTPLYSDMNPYIAGVPVSGGGGCLTDSVDQEQTDTSYETGMASTSRGQSFVVSKAGKISAIEISFNRNASDGDIEVRWGTSANLSTYIASATGTVTADGWLKFTFETKGDVSTGTTYYFAAMNAGGNDIEVHSDRTDPEYTSGQYYYGASAESWDMTNTISDRDLAFRVYLCD